MIFDRTVINNGLRTLPSKSPVFKPKSFLKYDFFLGTLNLLFITTYGWWDVDINFFMFVYITSILISLISAPGG